MHAHLHSKLFPRAALLAFALLGSAAALAASPDEAAFLAENQSAMTKMMSAMDIKPTGDVDRDFVAMMVPHHQAAIDMARAQLRYGSNEELRRLALDIIAAQSQEITVMRHAVGEPLSPTAPPTTSVDSMQMPMR